ncbi:ubl carboxyl-terminal hydrolase 18 [Scomber scombrus]|uniref:Ubl carboxyl-terminal hydrolase 18 n=1 Tax=Scomber scombrus TaxID=13677 RepID=A0AAV1MSL4_SCOSC|nr:ubl carboxyl-terminal hydrolase 18 [Scomber scombrus]
MEACIRFLSHLGFKDSHGMRGLNNYNLSCCVNTLLQTFSATLELANLLDKWDTASMRSDSGNVPLQLKKVLVAMRSDHPLPAPHRDFLHCLDRNRIQLSIQHDADEVFHSILDLMQKQMDNKTLALQIKDLYKISVQTQLKCINCDSVQTLDSYLISLPLHIKEDQNTLGDCMRSFFEHQELRGRDCCTCEQCGTKTPSKQGVKLLALPPILCVHLKRFRNIRGYTRKLNCEVIFPQTLNLSEMLREAFSADFAQNNCKYTLYAVVVHSGDAMCGHYTAYVRHSRSWYYADDSCVEKTSWQDVERTYGGHGRRTAYMLMYRRDSKEEGPQPECSG